MIPLYVGMIFKLSFVIGYGSYAKTVLQIEGFSEDAMMILKLFDAIFREDKLIKAGFSNPNDIRRERVLCIAPMLNYGLTYLK